MLPFRYNQFGYNVGGPFYIPGKFNKDKSKFFWYWGQEWVKYRFYDTATWTVPTALMRQGNFSELLTNTPQNILGKVVQLMDPNTKNPIPGNIIPAGAAQPERPRHSEGLSQRRLPVGSIGGNSNYYVTALHPQNQRKDTLAVDMNLTRQATPPVPPQQLRILRIPAAGRHADRDAEVLQPSQPDQFAGLRLDHQPEQGERTHRHRQPG